MVFHCAKRLAREIIMAETKQVVAGFPAIDVHDFASRALAEREIRAAGAPCYDVVFLIGDCIAQMARIAPPEAARLREFPPLVRRCVLVSALLESPVVPDVFGVLGDWVFSRHAPHWRAQAPPGRGLASAAATRLASEHHVLALGRSGSRNGAAGPIDMFEFTSPVSLAAFVRHVKGEK